MDSEEEIREEKKDSMENIQVSSKNPGGHNNNSSTNYKYIKISNISLMPFSIIGE